MTAPGRDRDVPPLGGFDLSTDPAPLSSSKARSAARRERYYLVARDADRTRVVEVEDDVQVTIGRSPEATLPVDHALVSRQHAMLWRRRRSLYVRDLGSRNGTRVNGERLQSTERALVGGDVVAVGPLEIVVAVANVVPAS